MEHLAPREHVGVVAGELLLLAVERSLGNAAQDRVVDVRRPRNRRVVAVLVRAIIFGGNAVLRLFEEVTVCPSTKRTDFGFQNTSRSREEPICEGKDEWV